MKRHVSTSNDGITQVRGVIFTSGLAREIFTAGNDLAELYAPKTSLERYTEFWTVSSTFLARLLRSPLVTVSALRCLVTSNVETIFWITYFDLLP